MAISIHYIGISETQEKKTKTQNEYCFVININHTLIITLQGATLKTTHLWYLADEMMPYQINLIIHLIVE